MDKTIKQIADELGVSKQAIFKKIKKEPLSTSLQKFTTTVDGIVYISVDGVKLIKSTFNYKDATTKSVNQSDNQTQTETQAIISMLQNELDIKNKQIEELNNRLAEVTQMATNSQELHKADKVQQMLLLESVEKKKKWKWFK